MAETLDLFAAWLRDTEVSRLIRLQPWLWPACEILHFFGLSILVGVAGFFDMRLLGFMRRVPLDAAWSLMPWARVGFGIAAATGVTFFVGAPDQYVNNLAFWWKIGFLTLAGANALYFERIYRRQLARGTPDLAIGSHRAIAAVSLVSWFFVVYWGRMLPFIGNAF